MVGAGIRLVQPVRFAAALPFTPVPKPAEDLDQLIASID